MTARDSEVVHELAMAIVSEVLKDRSRVVALLEETGAELMKLGLKKKCVGTQLEAMAWLDAALLVSQSNTKRKV